ncbi:MAG: dihydrolipoyl dehydrogenase [Bacteroidales bacterium]|nr:dihydrolipoyl dehydrogenase [Bacteroidales bacterium]
MYDIIIIGAGPAGYVSAIRAAQVGLKTLVIEKNNVGGMCLNWGCIKTKALIESAKLYDKIKTAENFGIEGIELKKISFNWEKAVKRADAIVRRLTSGIQYLFKKNNIDIIIGTAIITSKNTVTVDNRSIEGKNIIIATGSYPEKLLNNIDYTDIENLWKLKDLPKNIAVYGKGGTAIEIAQFLRMIDRNVSLIFPDDNVLPDIDDFLKNWILKKLKTDKINIVYSDKIKNQGKGIIEAGGQKIEAELLINASWRKAIKPKTEIDIETTENGYIKTNDAFQTNEPSIYAIGDVNGKSYLAHIASTQGIWVINKLKGINTDINLNLYPYNIYTSPEIAQIGMTEKQIKEAGIDYKISDFPLSANGKALTEDSYEGQIRLLSDKQYGEVLGVQIISNNATDMIAEAAAYMQLEGTIYDVAQTIHAHPTISEIFVEAGFDAIDKAIHK